MDHESYTRLVAHRPGGRRGALRNAKQLRSGSSTSSSLLRPGICEFTANVSKAGLGSRANVLTLSCKSRPPCRPPPGGAAAAATNMQWQERTAADVTRAGSSEPPECGSAAEPGLGGFCQLVRGYRPTTSLTLWTGDMVDTFLREGRKGRCHGRRPDLCSSGCDSLRIT